MYHWLVKMSSIARCHRVVNLAGLAQEYLDVPMAGEDEQYGKVSPGGLPGWSPNTCMLPSALLPGCHFLPGNY